MAKLLFWEPYNKAKLHGDFRDLIKAIERGDPMALHPDVLKLLAEQVKNRPPAANRKTSLKDSLPWADKINEAIRADTGKKHGKVTRAMNKVLDDHPDKSMEAIKDHWSEYLAAKRAHDQAARHEEND